MWEVLCLAYSGRKKKRKKIAFLSWKKRGKNERERQEKIKTKMEACHRDKLGNQQHRILWKK